jgi:FAD/FMN-containing dehydrogenase
VTIGGAIANDIHGKNHHVAGTFGRHVLRFELRRSDGARVVCSPTENNELFGATIGGLGLTGFMTWVDLQLQPIVGPFIKMESVKFRGLDEFFAISRSTGEELPYTVAWLDCVAGGADFCRGIFMRGAHAAVSSGGPASRRSGTPIAVPFDAPGWALNRWSVRAFNAGYFHRQREPRRESVVHYEPFFFPLDGILGWNKIYGRRGFFQFQGVIPGDAREALHDVMSAVVDSGQGSFLAVLKEFGSIPSPGWLSFPRRGVTFCLDFPNGGERTVGLMKHLEAMVIDAGGALYPAKDALMSPESFRAGFPRWREFLAQIDPAMISDFWRRVNEGGAA